MKTRTRFYIAFSSLDPAVKIHFDGTENFINPNSIKITAVKFKTRKQQLTTPRVRLI